MNKEVRIETSTVCNFNCEFCPNNTKYFKRKKEIMSLELFKFILMKLKFEAPEITDLTISGFGEAFIDNTIINKIILAKTQGLKIHILTNGSFLNEKTIDTLLKLKVADIRISIHSIIPEEYNKICGIKDNKILKKVMENIEYIKNNKSESTQLIISAEAVENNKNGINKLIDKYKDEVDLVEVWYPHNWIDWKKYRDGIKTKKTCNRPFNGPLQIQVDGTINMCCFDYNGELLLGDFKSQSLKEIYSSEAFKRIAEQHKYIEPISDIICNSCDQLFDNQKIVYYNSKFKEKERVGKLSTTHEKI